MINQLPRLPRNNKDWKELLSQLHCGIQVEVPAPEGHLQLRIQLEIEDDNTPYLLVVLGLYRSRPKSPSLWEGAEFFELGGQRIMCGFDPWSAVHQKSGAPLLQKTVEEVARSVIRNGLSDFACDVTNWIHQVE